MGAASSVGVEDNGQVKPARRRSDELPREPKKTLIRGVTEWKVIPQAAQLAQKFVQESYSPSRSATAVDPGHIELRTLLEDPLTQKSIGTFAKEIHTTESFFAWIEIQEYKSIPTPDYRRGMAMHIYEKYVKENAVLQVSAMLYIM